MAKCRYQELLLLVESGNFIYVISMKTNIYISIVNHHALATSDSQCMTIIHADEPEGRILLRT